MRTAAILLVAFAIIASVSADLIAGRCLTDGHTICPSVTDGPDFCCAPEDTCWRPLQNVSGALVFGSGGCVPRGGVGCADGHACAAGQQCCGAKCMPDGANCCGNGVAFCPNGVPCSQTNPLKCAGSMIAISPLLIFALLLSYLLL